MEITLTLLSLSKYINIDVDINIDKDMDIDIDIHRDVLYICPELHPVTSTFLPLHLGQVSYRHGVLELRPRRWAS